MDEPSTPPRRALDVVAQQARDILRPLSVRKTYAPGSLLWHEGDASGVLVALERGRVKIYRVLPNGHAITIFLFGPGDVFGFMPFLDGRPYPANAQALDEVDALVVRREALLEAFRSNPQLAMALIGLLAQRLRDAFERIERASIPEVLPRVAAALWSLVPEGAAAGPLAVVELPVPASELSVALRVLHRLGPRRFQVLDPDGLRSAAGAD